jgi:hypothetical protein
MLQDAASTPEHFESAHFNRLRMGFAEKLKTS